MRKLVLSCSLVAISVTSAWTQTLFTYGNNEVDKKDFVRIYEKNSINKSPDYSEKALREYLDLYSLFRMKVKEAELKKVDTMMSIQSELDNFRKQLAKNYFTDEKVNEQLVKEAYDRMQKDVRVAHILLMSSPMAMSKDTVAPYQKIDSIYNAVTSGGADFATMAKKYSQDQGSAAAGGDMGYFSALQTVYEFENASYNTPVGKVSKPFRTRFGYHIVKVLDKRDAIGTIQVQQILLNTTASAGAGAEAKAQKDAKAIFAELKKGASFESLVKKYSDDKYSKANDGILDPFGVGQMVPSFENAAISLKKPGDVYPKAVKTDYGYHIIKLIKKEPIKPFDSIKDNLEKRVARDSRADVARDVFFENVKKKNGYKEYPENVDEITQKLLQLPDTGSDAGMFTLDALGKMNKPVFEVQGKQYLQSDMMGYAMSITRGKIVGPKERFMNDLFNHYSRTVVQDVEEHNLVQDNPEFRAQMQEYRDGIMLFELMNKNVWGKASKDTTGLEDFYKNNKQNYNWGAGYRGVVYKFKNEDAFKAGMKVLNKKSFTDEDVLKAVNDDDQPNAVIIERGYFEFAKDKKFNKSEIVKGKPSTAKKNDDGTYSVAYAEEIFSNGTTKTLDEARGYVVADYQDHLEKEWNKELKAKYPVKINEKVFKGLTK